MGCGIFGILLKMEKVILVTSTHSASSPPPPGRPQKCQGKASPLEGLEALKQGLLWLQEGELALGAGPVT